MIDYIELGKKIYNMDNPREVHRMAVFVARAIIHNAGMQKLADFFYSNENLQELLDNKPFQLEQLTRAFFYKDSTFNERAKIIQEHYVFLEKKLVTPAFFDICKYNDVPGRVVWEYTFDDKSMQAILKTEGGQRKEGCTSLILKYDGQYLYQIMFWIARDRAGKYGLWIGAMQGPNMEQARDVIKRLTKLCYGYRTKNLILYITQGIARGLGLEKIYAVTNEGYYANNHIRRDRKLKTSFSDFWAEAGGEPTEDARFYTIPLTENRKTMEEVPTRKRAVYRRRFALMDEIDETVKKSMQLMVK